MKNNDTTNNNNYDGVKCNVFVNLLFTSAIAETKKKTLSKFKPIVTMIDKEVGIVQCP